MISTRLDLAGPSDLNTLALHNTILRTYHACMAGIEQSQWMRMKDKGIFDLHAVLLVVVLVVIILCHFLHREEYMSSPSSVAQPDTAHDHYYHYY